jgi:secreted trypsin-like serine protease
MRQRVLLIVLVLGTALGTVAAVLGPTPGNAVRASRRDAESEVMGGQAVPDGKYPFVAAVGQVSASGSLKKPFCGGSLIGPSSVLTAAHCVAGAQASKLAVAIGQTAFGTTQEKVAR